MCTETGWMGADWIQKTQGKVYWRLFWTR